MMMLSNAEILTQVLSCHTVDGAYHKLRTLKSQREEVLEEMLAYNKREQSESLTAKQILADNDTLAHKLLAEYHIEELKTRVKFNKPKVNGIRRELDFMEKLMVALEPYCVYNKQATLDAEQSALYDEHVLSTIWLAYTTFQTTDNKFDVINIVRSLPFDAAFVLVYFNQLYTSPSHLFFTMGISKHITLLNRVKLPEPCVSKITFDCPPKEICND